MKGYRKFIKAVVVLLMCLSLLGCGIYESNEKKSLRISTSIVDAIAANDYDNFRLVFSEEARAYLHGSIDDYHFQQVIFGKKLHICYSKIYGSLKQLGMHQYESFDVECLIKDDDNHYYLLLYTYCERDESRRSIGIKRMVIVHSDENSVLSDESMAFFQDLDKYGFYPNI